MKSNINDEYRKIMEDLEGHIEDKKDFEYAKSQLEKLSMMFISEMENMTKTYQNKLDILEDKQESLEQKLKDVQKVVNNIEKDIYDGEMDGDSYEFEITCPYCNNDFVAELDDVRDEIQCPECKNIIELDWEHSCEDDECSGSCSGCHGCGSEEDDEEDNDDDM